MSATPRNRVQVLVIDDQKDRDEVYSACLRRVNEILGGKWLLDLRLCHDLASTAALIREAGEPALAIVDMVLDTDGWTSTSVGLLDRKLLSERWPLLLVSGRFDESVALDRANYLLSGSVADSIPLQFLPWSTIEQGSDTPGVANQLAFIIDTLLSRDTKQDLLFSKGPGDPVDLLHITDAHFGKASWDAGALMMLRAKFDDHALNGADFLVLSGDIADHGSPQQYAAASSYLVAIAHNGLVAANDSSRPPRERVLMCPGNHDFSRPVALGANVLEKSGKYSVSTKPSPESSWMRKLAWAPYYSFEEDMTGRRDSWIEDPGYRINTRFRSWSLLFVELNVERYSIDGYQPGLADIEMQARLNHAAARIAEFRRKGDCLIVVAHRHESNAWSSLARMLHSFLAGLGTTGPVLLLCGHEHTAKVSAECSDRALVIQGVPPVDGPSLPNRVLPIVHYVRLERTDGFVSGVSAYAFHQERTAWLESGGVRRFVWNERAGWCKAQD